MRLSLCEVDAMVYKAMTGAGFTPGLAKDIASACSWLARRNVEFMAELLDELENSATEETIKLDETDNSHIGFGGNFACVPSAFDLLIAEGSCHAIVLAKPIGGNLLAGMAGVTGAQYGVEIQLDFPDGAMVCVDGTKITLSRGEPLPAAGVRISVRGNSKNEQPPALKPIHIRDDLWERITVLAQKAFVPESSASRQSGAGAGEFDND